ncbi:hypothetical protein WAI453_000642 [Rhynchosporium graminicola]
MNKKIDTHTFFSRTFKLESTTAWNHAPNILPIAQVSPTGLGLNLRDKPSASFKKIHIPTEPSSHQPYPKIGLRMPDSHWAMLEIAPGELFEGEVSRWSSDSSDYTSASSAGGTDSAEEQPEIEDIVMETTEEKFERHRRFFQGEPLMRCLREEEDKYGNWMDTILFENLYHEVQYGLRDTRSQEEVREYWKEVRYKLRIDDSEIASSPDSFTENDTFSQIAPVVSRVLFRGWKRPTNLCPTSGKDLELQEIRIFLVDRKTSLRRAATC